MWLLTIPPHIKYVTTVPCNLLLIACFVTNVSQRSVAHMQGVLGFLITVLLQIY